MKGCLRGLVNKIESRSGLFFSSTLIISATPKSRGTLFLNIRYPTRIIRASSIFALTPTVLRQSGHSALTGLERGLFEFVRW